MRTIGLLSILLLGGAAPSRPDKPNFIVILADDLGWTDLGCFGSAFYETPNLDRLAARGVRFTHAYSACTVCSPTRASLLTGRYPARLRVTDWIPGHKRPDAKLRVPEWTQRLEPGEFTLAEALREHGYATASMGKWHLGGEAHFPEKHGFDRNVAGTHQGQPPSYHSPYKIATLADGPAGEYLTDRLAAEAARYIEEHKDRPFFLYLPQFAVHTPLQARKEKVEKYRAKAKAGGHSNAVYGAMIESMDEGVGTILAKLEELKIAERTVVVFTSDNGGLLRSTSNAPLRAGKGSAYEGGVRVPLIVAWPGELRAGAVCDTPAITPDLAPTLLELAGAKADPARFVDGASLAALLRGKGDVKREAIYWHYPHYHPGGATPYGALRRGHEKLVEFFEDGRCELYDLAQDSGETNDLAAGRPERVRELKKQLADWREAVGAQMPSANPDFKPKK